MQRASLGQSFWTDIAQCMKKCPLKSFHKSSFKKVADNVVYILGKNRFS